MLLASAGRRLAPTSTGESATFSVARTTTYPRCRETSVAFAGASRTLPSAVSYRVW